MILYGVGGVESVTKWCCDQNFGTGHIGQTAENVKASSSRWELGRYREGHHQADIRK